MIRYRFGPVALCAVAAATAAGLGLLTARQNVVGWWVVLFGLACLWGGARYRAAAHSDPGQAYDTRRASLWWLAPGLAAVFLGAPLEWLVLLPRLPRELIDQALGLGLIAAGWLLWAWTRWALLQPDAEHRLASNRQRLNRRGPYRFVRHPDDTTLVLVALGVAQGFSSVIALAAIPLLLLPAIGNRIWLEEEQLLVAFGPEYREYQRTTRRLLPGLW